MVAEKQGQGGGPKSMEADEAQKRLLIVLLLKLGASPDEVGVAIGVSGRRVRQMFKDRKFKVLDFGQGKTQS